jgi:hypothetical protein
VLVSQAWRVHALAAEFAARGLAISWEPTDDGAYWVRTSYSSTLVRLTPPSFLDGVRLRLWFLASGELEEGEEHGVLLGLGHNQALARPALAPLGLDGEVVKGPAIRIVGEAKRRRLADLIGESPARAPRGAWPIASRPPAQIPGRSPVPIPGRPSAPIAGQTDTPAGGPNASAGVAGVRQPVVRPRRPADGNVLGLWPVDPCDLPEIAAPPTEPTEEEPAQAPKPRGARAANGSKRKPASTG